MSSSFDPDNYESPIKYFYEDSYISMHYNRTIMNTVYIKKNTVILHDDLFGIFSNEINDYFYERSSMEYSTADSYNEEVTDGAIFLQGIKIDKEKDIYER